MGDIPELLKGKVAMQQLFSKQSGVSFHLPPSISHVNVGAGAFR